MLKKEPSTQNQIHIPTIGQSFVAIVELAKTTNKQTKKEIASIFRVKNTINNECMYSLNLLAKDIENDKLKFIVLKSIFRVK